ncbi:MAG: alternate F1F0 ATPase, F1 subunit alpha [Desulfobacterales bacterium]
MNEKKSLTGTLDRMFLAAEKTLDQYPAELAIKEAGNITSVGRGIVRVSGLPGVKSDELVEFPGGRMGIAFNLEPDEVLVVTLCRSEELEAGMEARRTGRVTDVPVGEAMLGRVVDPLGNQLDGMEKPVTTMRYTIERESPSIMDRAAVTVPLHTGIVAIDALIPIGRGQRELILGDRQTGKTAITIDTIINQKNSGVVCIYCSIGQQTSAVAKVVADLKKYGAMEYTTVVVASSDEPPGINFIAPYSATSIAEYFMEKGRDVLIVYDDLSRHARSYRELSLLLRRPPAREAFPGDIFYIHSRLLERATHLSEEKGGGSLTALPIAETEAQNIAAYIPTNLVSITDGQIYLSPKLFQEGVLPPIDIGKSVSRVGGHTQLPVYRSVAGDLKISYAQFEELEVFERFSTRLDEATRRALERGHRIREMLKQPQYAPFSVPGQIGMLLAVTSGSLDGVPLENIKKAAQKIRDDMENKRPDIVDKINSGQTLEDKDSLSIILLAQEASAIVTS